MNAPASPTRFFNVRAWWHSLPEHRQDRLVSFGPLLSVLLFGLVVVVSMSYLRTREIAAVRQALRNDGEYAHQFFSARLSRQREALQHAAQQLAAAPASDAHAFEQAARHAGAGLPELTGLLWLDEAGRIIASAPPLAAPAAVTGQPAARSLSMVESELLARARQSLAPHPTQPVYDIMASTQSLSADAMLGLMVPVQAPTPGSTPKGFLYARYSLPSVLYYGMPADIYPRYAVRLLRPAPGSLTAAITRQGLYESGSWLRPGHTAYTLPLPAEGLALRLQTHHASAGLRNRMLLLVLALSGFTGWTLIANWRYLRRRQRAQQVLQAETSFRRAMEDSLQTGMRALDLQGRITYVNASFCQMTGLSEAELVGQTPPFSFWPAEEVERNTHILQEAFSNMAMRGGYEVRIRHKDGHVFDARTYITPLIGAGGQHTGWMSAMTDITEPKRIRRELAASQERFARVLDAIDTAVSVAPLGAKELLFANHFYRQWFGDDNARAHMHILEQAASQPQESMRLLPPGALPSNGGNNAEIFLEQTQRWVEVRSRYLEWTDGRLAQLVVATDITARRLAEARSAEHEQQAHAASRLVTMGEMASSVAHELNQPLTAIHNYCSGMRSRLANNSIEPHELLGALEKTARQAQRAGQIIQRIREFVKRSAPNYRWVDVQHMVEDAVDLAEIEMRRRQVRLIRSIADGLPEIMADRILIEQVLVNLMKNAAEAIDNAQMPVERREVRLEVGKTHVDGKEVIRFALCDRGPGLSKDVLSNLFEAFFTTKAEGLGIGLNLCRSIVESHQGRLHAENLYNSSKPQEVVGCCFSFWLPAQPLVAEPPDVQDSHDEQGA
ncbi:MAG: PAS domain S-box protein [Brachymonas sp.]|nr:PAS domain S-box protein [Brachymonas sp.]